jgi:hypothetical protein
MMVVRSIQWFLQQINLGLHLWQANVNLPSTPDTVLSDCWSLANTADFQYYESQAIHPQTAIPKPIFYHREDTPRVLMEVNLPSAPDTVLQFWEGGANTMVVFYTIDKFTNARIPVFAGDMGAYIG